ncbi:FG-GAP-like repeat-containing protein [Salipaludibacillus aurantiacus]|uniref:Repeat domain-containing protein n=1 Tax=Salipaludibacillus aurantiacus TaxID=1601833 RepID=A0A1H9TYP5_9BACI|nr:FG-GAP-like repeat-containing protein [Salipaludibacillus aurantiacus]SES02138.1 Repeat domain-containing protein [Salipaludibacillus aurantiacus]
MYRNYFYPNMRITGVVASATGDVNGDGLQDIVYVTGYRETDVSIIQNMTLGIQDGATGVSVSIPLQKNMGYDPRIFLGDFTGDGIKDILITIPTGGSGGTTNNYIYSFVNNEPRLLFDSDAFNQSYQYEVTYKDDYKVEVFSIRNNMRYIIDLSLRGPDYLNEIYDAEGKLKTPVSGWVDPISGIHPMDLEYDNFFDLMAYQQIAGTFHADTIGTIQNRLKWNGYVFVLDYQELGIYGSEE